MTDDNTRTPTTERATVNAITLTAKSGLMRATAVRGNGEILKSVCYGPIVALASKQWACALSMTHTEMLQLHRTYVVATRRPRSDRLPPPRWRPKIDILLSRIHDVIVRFRKRDLSECIRLVSDVSRVQWTVDKPLTTFVIAVYSVYTILAKRTDQSAL